MNIAVVLPVHNEAKVLARTTEAVHGWARQRFPAGAFRIIISENGSTDGSDLIAKTLAARLPGVEALVSEKAGKGGAIKRGILAAEADVYLSMDCDLSTRLDSAAKLVALVQEGTDLAIASRRMPDSEVERPLHRRVVTWAYSGVASRYLGLGIRDAQCGCKAYSRRVRDAVIPGIEDEGFFFDTELLAKARKLGLGIAEVGVVWKERSTGPSSVPLSATAWDFLRKLPRLKRRIDAWPPS